jgi:hypothetical protein
MSRSTSTTVGLGVDVWATPTPVPNSESQKPAAQADVVIGRRARIVQALLACEGFYRIGRNVPW